LVLQCLHKVTSPGERVALHPRQASLTFANFMIPPEAKEGVVTWMLLVCSPVKGNQRVSSGWASSDRTNIRKLVEPIQDSVVNRISYCALDKYSTFLLFLCKKSNSFNFKLELFRKSRAKFFSERWKGAFALIFATKGEFRLNSILSSSLKWCSFCFGCSSVFFACYYVHFTSLPFATRRKKTRAFSKFEIEENSQSTPFESLPCANGMSLVAYTSGL
jgi:hypothetical protein